MRIEGTVRLRGGEAGVGRGPLTTRFGATPAWSLFHTTRTGEVRVGAERVTRTSPHPGLPATATTPRRASVTVALALLVALVVAEATHPQLAAAKQWSWLGVRIRDLTEQEMDEISSRHGIREGFGVVVVEVLDDTPAAAAGLRNGDIVVAFEGRPITETRLLQRLIAQARSGTDTRLTVLRAEGRAPLTVRLVEMPRPMVGDRIAVEFGFLMREPETAGEGTGVRLTLGPPAISVVVKGSRAEQAGLEVGDVIVQVNDRPVVTRDAAREALADAVVEQPLRLTIRRGDRLVPTTLRAP